MSQSLMSSDHKDVEVPLMAMNDEASDGVEDHVVASGKKKSRFNLWSPFSNQRYRSVPTGGKRNWKEGSADGKRDRCRAWTCIPLTILVIMSIVLVVYLVYPLAHRNYIVVPQPKYPWTTTFCTTAMRRLVMMCPCLLEVDIVTTTRIFKQKYDLAVCVDNCVNGGRPESDNVPSAEEYYDEKDY